MSNQSTKLSDFFTFNDLSLSKLMVKDVDETVALLNSAFRYQELATGHKRTDRNHLLSKMRELSCFVVKNRSEIVGTVAYETNDTTLHFGLMSVSNEYRGKGLAQAIVHAVEEYAKSQSYMILELDYMSIAPWLKKYYEKYGFEETGHTVTWKEVNLIQMQKPLT